MTHSFAYRQPRIAVRLPVEFSTEHGLLFGYTRDLNDGGFSADWGEPVPLQTNGRVRFRTGHCLLELQARVTHTEGFTAGLAFLFLSEREAAFVHALLQAFEQAASSGKGRKARPRGHYESA